MESQQLGKRQRTNSQGHANQRSYAGYDQMYASPNIPVQQQLQQQQRYVTPNDLWAKICTLDESFVRETLFYAAVGELSQPQILSKVVDIQGTLYREEALRMDARRKEEEARLREESRRMEAHRKIEESRLEPAREQLIDFDHHVASISAYLENDPADGKRMVYNAFENTIVPRIMDIEKKSAMPNSNFVTRYNGLEALRKIAEAVCVNSKGIHGGEIASKFVSNHDIEEAMLAILKSMDPKQRRYLCYFKSDEREWWEKVKALWELGEQKCNGQDLFKRLDEVIELLKSDLSRDEGKIQQQADVVGRAAQPHAGQPLGAVGGPGSMVNQRQFSSPSQQQHMLSQQQQQHILPQRQNTHAYMPNSPFPPQAVQNMTSKTPQSQYTHLPPTHPQDELQAQQMAQDQQYRQRQRQQQQQHDLANPAYAARQPTSYYTPAYIQQGVQQNPKPLPPNTREKYLPDEPPNGQFYSE